MKRFIPSRLRAGLSYLKTASVVIKNGLYDSLRVIKHTHFWNRSYGQMQLEAKLWAQSHVLEKGLSLPQTRLGYGVDGVRALLELCSRYTSGGFPLDRPAFKNAVGVLNSYVEFHEINRFDVTQIKEKIADLDEASCERKTTAGLFEFSKKQYQALALGDFSSLAGSRYSIRAFGDAKVETDDVLKALEIARKTPSACNRQSWNVHWIRSPDAVASLLEIQSGHRGFGHQADSFLVITSDIQSYFGVEERHQTYVDGGLYSMSVLYALHYVGLGACPLNWCVVSSKDKKMRNALCIQDSENIIMIIAIGTLPDKVKAARSLRKAVNDTLKVI